MNGEGNWTWPNHTHQANGDIPVDFHGFVLPLYLLTGMIIDEETAPSSAEAKFAGIQFEKQLNI